MFVNDENLPDVLVCMDEVVTECVYQALIDYNQVGNVKVIGFYYSDVILDAIDKEIISSAIALDMDEIGRYSVNALDEYSSLGHSNNYYSVNQHVITKENTKDYRTEVMRNETGKEISSVSQQTDPTERSYASGSCVCAGNQCVYL